VFALVELWLATSGVDVGTLIGSEEEEPAGVAGERAPSVGGAGAQPKTSESAMREMEWRITGGASNPELEPKRSAPSNRSAIALGLHRSRMSSITSLWVRAQLLRVEPATF
jgi:hypothetical protein